ncbi:hypothetical protein ABL840_20620 [Variovorax sp. NFACC27]|uniref:hypothetical protein n=1 Tax=unclassified Variovorax TaxID=663243 RepID=UPI0008E6A8A7|nr:hypothetical protein SAMN03159379_06932 [Variovorax sp. NFACC26]
MLHFLRTLFGGKSGRPISGDVEPTAQQGLLPPAVISADGLPDLHLSQHLSLHEGFPAMKWAEVESWLSDTESPAAQAHAWEAAEKAWLLHFRQALGPAFQLREAESAMLLSSLDDGVARATLHYMVRTLARVAATLDGLAQIPSWGKDILIVFDDAESYYRYVAHYYPDQGEFAFSSGMYINDGCAHFVTVKADLSAIEPVIAHEMTHSCLAHLPLPLWLNEGLAVNTELRITGGSGSYPGTHELRRKHLGFWGPQEIQEFWSGESFKRTDDGNMLSYDLARLIVSHFASDWEAFKRFVLDADASDAGAASARENLHIDLGALACALLEKEPSPPWGPQPQNWEQPSVPPTQRDTVRTG